MAQKLFSKHDAAEYLGISVNAIKYHIYHSGRLHPQKLGNMLVFTQADLDAFQTEKDAGPHQKLHAGTVTTPAAAMHEIDLAVTPVYCAGFLVTNIDYPGSKPGYYAVTVEDANGHPMTMDVWGSAHLALESD